MEFMKTRDVAQLLGVHKDTIRLWSRDGKMPRPVKFGEHSFRYEKEEITRWIETVRGQK